MTLDPTPISLLTYTLQVMEQSRVHPSDVEWVGNREGSIQGTWDDFAKVAKDVIFTQDTEDRVARDLVITGSDWWMTWESDGDDYRHWFEFHRKPVLQPNPAPFPTQPVGIVDDYCTHVRVDGQEILDDWQDAINREQARLEGKSYWND